MKRILSFGLFLLISVAVVFQPLPVFASDIIVDDNNIIDSSDALTLSERIVTMQLFSDALMQGSSDFVISKGTESSFDSWLDGIISSIHSDLYNDVTGFLEFKQNFNDAVVNVFNSIGDLVDSGVDTLEELLGGSTGEYKAHYLQVPHVINGFRSIAQETEIPTPQPLPDYSSLVSQIQSFSCTVPYGGGSSLSFNSRYQLNSGSGPGDVYLNTTNISIVCLDSNFIQRSGTFNLYSVYYKDLGTIFLTNNGDGTYSAVYSGFSSSVKPLNGNYNYFYNLTNVRAEKFYYTGVYNDNTNITNNAQSSFAGLSTAMNYLVQHFRHCNLYVDGVPWILIDSSSVQPSSITLGGDTIINNYNYPVRYVFKESQPVLIDYEKLYQVIKKAFDDGTSTSLTTINNGDVFINSNNTTVYPSVDIDIPDIDSDLINTFLKYCAIPVFEASMLAPLHEVAVAGNLVAVVSTSWIPSDLLLIFAGFFVLILFIYLIHRLIE